MTCIKRLSEKKEHIVIGMLVLGILTLVCCVCPVYYSMNDDVMMKSILSGTYTGTPDGHAVYMKYPLTGIISLLYRIAGGIPWFDLMLLGCFWISVSGVICRTCSICKGCKNSWLKWFLPCVVGIMCVALFFPWVLTLHYTLVAAMVGGCALFLMMTGGGALSVLLLVLCYCIRSQVFFLLLPFLGVVILWRVLAAWREKTVKRPLFAEGVALVAGIVMCMLWNGFMYHGEEWQQYLAYNDSRTRLYDYEYLVPYEDYREAYDAAGISKSHHSIMEQYALVLDETVDAAMMDAASELSDEYAKDTLSLRDSLIESVREYYYHLRYGDVPYKNLLICGYLLVLVLLLWKKQIWDLLLVCCMAGGRSCIWVYLIWKGRFPERIYVSLYFIELMILAGMVITTLLHAKRKSANPEAEPAWKLVVKKVATLAMVIVVGIISINIGRKEGEEMYWRSMINRQDQVVWDALVQYCEDHPEETYFLDIYSIVDYSGRVLDNNTTQENYILAGGWMSESPLLRERFGEARDGGELLLQDSKGFAYIMETGRNSDWLEAYFQERVGDVQIERTDSVLIDGVEMFEVLRIKMR